MRRLVALACLAALAAVALSLMAIGGTSGNYRIDAIFDSASFLIPGQDVKIAGARVGSVKDVTLTPDNKARIKMEIDPRFAPFHADADCTIQPQSLIGEKFIQCSPGTPRAAAIVRRDGQAPTVPLTNTHSPVDLDLVFSTFRRPTNERTALIVSELGAGLAGRGGDLNEAIRRANPALQETNRVLDIVRADRVRVSKLIHESRSVLDELAARRKAAAGFIDSAGRVSKIAADHRAALKKTVQGLPALLREAEPSLRSLQLLAEQGTPILRNLRKAAPQLTRLGRDFGPLSVAARPAIRRLGAASAAGQDALNAAKPVAKKLKGFASAAGPTSSQLQELFDSMRKTGTVEGLTNFTYYSALATSRFDATSHMLPAFVLGSSCGGYVTTTAPGCDAHLSGKGVTRRATRRHSSHAKQRKPAATKPADTPAPSAPSSTPAPGGSITLNIPGIPPIKVTGPGSLLGGLLGSGSGGGKGDSAPNNSVKDLLGYLLG